jgi:hypothetical protein
MRQFFIQGSTSAKLALTATTLAALVACGGGDDAAPALIAIADVRALAIAPATAAAATAGLTSAATGFTFPAGVPALGTTASTTVKFTAPAAGTSTPAFAIASGTGTATGTMSFGSCIFNITSSTIPGIIAPSAITVTPCEFDVNTAGKTVTEGTTGSIATTATLLLGTGATSAGAAVTVTVSNSGGTNTVTINGGALGTVTGTVTTGAGN